MPVEEQVVVIFAGSSGALDDVPVEDVSRFEAELLDVFRSRHADLLDDIRKTGKLPSEDAMKQAVADFKTNFLGTTPAGPTGDAMLDDAEAVGEAESHKTLATE
jgi:F-type H+-transporting ATPase subunit alpha